MSLNLEDVQRLASLAKLTLSEAESEQTLGQLNQVFELIETMQAADTEGVEPLTHPQDAVLRLRPDEVSESDQRDDFQQVAPQTDRGLYLVPKVIE
ncbi:MAG: Asp-tRNA(Asn)/Glu-tRNA(Gln) amidotransferase subunit GatC [Burkholderiaceae bacterium]